MEAVLVRWREVCDIKRRCDVEHKKGEANERRKEKAMVGILMP